MKIDIVLGFVSLMTTLIGQAAISDALPAMLTQFGGLGVAVWLTIHHTMVTIPRMQSEFRAERTEMLALFSKTLDEKRHDYVAAIDQQRKDFEAIVSKVSCRAESFKSGNQNQ